jgi:hypothetical protein
MVRTVPQINYARSADGVSLAFTIAGNGPALVFVPWVPFSNLRMEWQNPMSAPRSSSSAPSGDAGQGQRMLDEAGMKTTRFMVPAQAVARA